MNHFSIRQLCQRRFLTFAIIYFAVYLFVYGYVILRLGLDPDEVLDFQGEMTSMYVANGRWGNALYRWGMHGGAVPYAAGLAAGVYLSLAYILQILIIKLKNLPGIILYGAISLGITQFSYFEVYTHNADAIALGILSISASVYCLQYCDSAKFRIPVSLFLLAFGVSTYQTLAALYGVLCLAAYLRRSEEEKSTCMPFFREIVIVGGAGLALYYACHYAFLATGIAPPELIDAVEKYHRQLATSWSFFPDFTLYEKIRFVGYIIKQIVFHCLGMQYEGEWLYATAAVPVALLLSRYYQNRTSMIEFAWRGGMVLAIWVFPNLFVFYFVDLYGPRILLSQPAACACLWGLAVHAVPSSTRTTACIALCSILVTLKASYCVSSMAYREKMDHENRVSLMRHIYNSAVQAASAAGIDQKTVQVVLVDSAMHLNDPGSKAELYLVTRAHWYARTLHLPHLRGATEEELTPNLKEKLLHCQPWPSANCYVTTPQHIYVRIASRSVADHPCRL